MLRSLAEEEDYLRSLRVTLDEVPWLGDAGHEERRIKIILERLNLSAPLDWRERRRLADKMDRHHLLLERDEYDINLYWAVQYLVKP